MKPLVYIAGPYSQPDPVINTRRACLLGSDLTDDGCAVFIPHLSMLWHTIDPRDTETWHARDLDVLEHCDALVRFPGFSVGADREMERASELRMAIFTLPESRESFRRWILAWRGMVNIKTNRTML